MEFTTHGMQLRFNGMIFLQYSDAFLSVSEDISDTCGNSRAAIPLAQEELEPARATLLHMYRRSLQGRDRDIFESVLEAVQVAAFAHKYAALAVLADCDSFFRTRVAPTLNKQQFKGSSGFPIANIFTSEACESWSVLSWISWLDCFDPVDLPLFRTACTAELIKHKEFKSHTKCVASLQPAALDRILTKLVTDPPSSTCHIQWVCPCGRRGATIG